MFSRFFAKFVSAKDERSRKALLTSVMNVVSQVLQLATGLVSVPLALNYLGSEQFGVWMALSTALTFISFSDFGIGIGVQDRMSRLIGARQYEDSRKTFLSAAVVLIAVLIVLILVGCSVVTSVDVVRILSIKSSEASREVIPTTLMVIFVLGLGLLSGLVQRAFNALQEGFWVAIIQIISRLTSLVMLFVVVHLEMGLPILVFVVGGMASVFLLVIGLPLLLYRHPWLVPIKGIKAEFFSLSNLRPVLRVGGAGLGASAAIYLVNNMPMVIMSAKYGAVSIADYAILLKLIGIPTMLLTYSLLPFWPAITDAVARNEREWILVIYKKAALLTIVVASISSIVLAFFGVWLIEKWTNEVDVVPSTSLMGACIVFSIIGYWNALSSMMLNGLSMYRGQSLYGGALAIISAAVAMMLPVSYEKEAVIWVISIGYMCRCALMQAEILRWTYKK